MRIRTYLWLFLLMWLACAPGLRADTPASADATVTASGTADSGPPAAELKIANRVVMVFRGELLGESPEIRAARARLAIGEVLDSSTEPKVTVDSVQSSYMVLLGDRRAFFVTPNDVGADDSDVHALALQAAERLRQVVVESREARSVRFLLIAAAATVVATLIYLALVRGLYWLRNRLLGLLPTVMRRHTEALKIGHTPLFDSTVLFLVIRRVVWLLYWILVLLASYEWLSFVLSRFPYTRPWGESLNIYLIELASYLLGNMVGAIPGLVVALAIFFIARGFSAFSRRLWQRLARPGTISWLNQETLQPTERLTSLAIWLFAVAMAYPYLPGAGTDAFKGLSVLIGLMISLGASSVVGQAAAGLILTYTRTLRTGEFVRIGEHEGTVTEVGMFTTTIRTGLGEVLTIPNSAITGAVTKNYSRTVQGPGYVVDTVVTIGYDTPWRQVEAMLLEAARRTDGILERPAPYVFQTALSDFYPEYRLVAQAVPSEPRPRAMLLSMLHANIQDVFNEYGVQIMSPHYLGDPREAKWVPREQWYPAPAKPPKAPE